MYSVSDSSGSSDTTKFEFKFLSVNGVPLARGFSGFTVSEDSTHGTSIWLNGSDSDSKYVAYILTKLPTKGKLFRTTGEPIRVPFTVFEVCCAELWHVDSRT